VPDPRPLPRLPRLDSDAWRGGFVIDSPAYTRSVSALAGTVVAGTECIYRLRPGATQFHSRPLPARAIEVLDFAVEPRVANRPVRFAAATSPRALHLVDDKGVATVPFPEDHGEVLGLMWAPRLVNERPTMCLHLRFEQFQLLLVPDGRTGDFARTEFPAPQVVAMATDGAGGLAFAVLDEEEWFLDVWWLIDLEKDEWFHRGLEAPSFFDGARLAVAGKAVAVSAGREVWMSRDPMEHEFVEIEALRSRDDAFVEGGAAIAFDGAGPDAALFAAVREAKERSAIVRVDAEGRHERIVELTVEGQDGDGSPGGGEGEGDEGPPAPIIHEMAWDATRRTLWSAAGEAGVMCTTEPGSPVPLGETGAKRAAS
jgi:hypothetical protein